MQTRKNIKKNNGITYTVEHITYRFRTKIVRFIK